MGEKHAHLCREVPADSRVPFLSMEKSWHEMGSMSSLYQVAWNLGPRFDDGPRSNEERSFRAASNRAIWAEKRLAIMDKGSGKWPQTWAISRQSHPNQTRWHSIISETTSFLMVYHTPEVRNPALAMRVHVQDWLLEPISLIPCSLRMSFARKMTQTRFSPSFTGELWDSNMESSPLIGSGASKCLERISCSRCVVQSHQSSY